MCDCIKQVDKQLEPFNTMLVTTIPFDGTDQKVALYVDKVESKKRGKVKNVIASYCPFCGHKYDEKESAR